ncbi:hypothetical protein, partial [Acinetobacter sp. AGC35]
MTAASVAGIPLSGKGLAQQLGLTNTASAAAVSQNAAVKEKIKKIYSKLDATGVKNLIAYQTEAGTISKDKFASIFSVLLENQKLDLTPAEKDTAYTAFTSVSSVV